MGTPTVVMGRDADALHNCYDPDRGPLDLTANVMDGHDYSNRGSLDRAANAITARRRGRGGDRWPLDRASWAR
jgi:hypothetical protein